MAQDARWDQARPVHAETGATGRRRTFGDAALGDAVLTHKSTAGTAEWDAFAAGARPNALGGRPDAVGRRRGLGGRGR